MRKSLYFLPLLFSFAMSAQQSIPRVLKMLNKESVPYIKVAELKDKKNLIYLDAREPKEYQVSHIKNALFVVDDCIGKDLEIYNNYYNHCGISKNGMIFITITIIIIITITITITIYILFTCSL